MPWIIAPNDADWASPEETKAEVLRLEETLGGRLTEPFRSFLETYNGGAVYPLIFRCGENEYYLDRLYSVEWIQHLLQGTVFGCGLPTGFLPIGQDPGGLEILLCLEAHRSGQIFAWPLTSEPWGGPTNSEERLVKLGSCFRTFVQSLYDTEASEGWEHWYTHRRRDLQRPLTLVC